MSAQGTGAEVMEPRDELQVFRLGGIAEGSVNADGRVVASSGLRMLEPETRVRVGTQKGDKGPLAVKVELI